MTLNQFIIPLVAIILSALALISLHYAERFCANYMLTLSEVHVRWQRKVSAFAVTVNTINDLLAKIRMDNYTKNYTLAETLAGDIDSLIAARKLMYAKYKSLQKFDAYYYVAVKATSGLFDITPYFNAFKNVEHDIAELYAKLGTAGVPPVIAAISTRPAGGMLI